MLLPIFATLTREPPPGAEPSSFLRNRITAWNLLNAVTRKLLFFMMGAEPMALKRTMILEGSFAVWVDSAWRAAGE